MSKPNKYKAPLVKIFSDPDVRLSKRQLAEMVGATTEEDMKVLTACLHTLVRDWEITCSCHRYMTRSTFKKDEWAPAATIPGAVVIACRHTQPTGPGMSLAWRRPEGAIS